MLFIRVLYFTILARVQSSKKIFVWAHWYCFVKSCKSFDINLVYRYATFELLFVNIYDVHQGKNNYCLCGNSWNYFIANNSAVSCKRCIFKRKWDYKSWLYKGWETFVIRNKKIHFWLWGDHKSQPRSERR